MLSAAKLQTRHVPIIAEDGFRFPSKSMLQEIELSIPNMTMNNKYEPKVVVSVIEDVFKESALLNHTFLISGCEGGILGVQIYGKLVAF